MSQTRRSKHHSIFERIERKVDTLLQLMKKYHVEPKEEEPLLTPQLTRSTSTPEPEPTLTTKTRKSREIVYPDGLQKFNEFVKSMHENLKQDNPNATYQEALQKAAPLWREKNKNSKTITRKVNKTPGRFSPQRNLASPSMTSQVELTPEAKAQVTPDDSEFTPEEDSDEEEDYTLQNQSQIPTLIPSISKRENTPYPK